VQTIGWTAAGLTVALNFLVFVLGDWISGRTCWWRAVKTIAVIALILLVALGLLELRHVRDDLDKWLGN